MYEDIYVAKPGSNSGEYYRAEVAQGHPEMSSGSVMGFPGFSQESARVTLINPEDMPQQFVIKSSDLGGGKIGGKANFFAYLLQLS